MNKLNTLISLYFNLSRKESNGLLILFSMALISICLPPLLKYVLVKPNSTEVSDQETISRIMAHMDSTYDSIEPFQKKSYTKTKRIHYTLFNPNTADKETLLQNGIHGFIADRILKFRKAGGVFKESKDLLKIYGLRKSDYDKFYPYINIPKQELKTQRVSNPSKYIPVQATLFNINEADSTQLKSIKGIGSVFASRILRYRAKLGGFITYSQLKEIYGLDSATFEGLKKTSFIETDFQPKKINLNHCSYETLHQHPYIGKKLAYLIIQYRNQHGNFKSVDALNAIKTIDQKVLTQLTPYLTLQ